MIAHTIINRMKLCLTVNLSKSGSFPTNPTAAAATAIDCGEIILPTTPPDALAATANSGSIPTLLAVTCCNLANSKLADVSEPVMNTPQSIAVAAAAVGLVGKEPDLLKFTVKHSFILLIIVCAIIALQSTGVLGWMIPVHP